MSVVTHNLELEQRRAWIPARAGMTLWVWSTFERIGCPPESGAASMVRLSNHKVVAYRHRPYVHGRYHRAPSGTVSGTGS